MDILSETILYQNGSFKRIRRYLRGEHPELGVLAKGFTGMETIVEIDILVPVCKFAVIDLTPSVVVFEELTV